MEFSLQAALSPSRLKPTPNLSSRAHSARELGRGHDSCADQLTERVLCNSLRCIGAETIMPEQITVRLPKDLSGALEIASRKMKRRNSEIVRMALRQFLQLTNADGRRPAERVRGLLGS